ncbi:MAG: hypothetical protein ACW96X_03960 [Promethearchaeota archaeon]|jgi:hypothetical protein
MKLEPNKTFKLNEFLSLRLDGNKTKILVNDRQFRQCKFLLLVIPVDKISTFDEIDSIDEASEKLDASLEGIGEKKLEIPVETEFWGHCSNLQVWVENKYDTRLLHRSLAFPLLKKLTEVGDPDARKVFKEEIAKRILSGNANIFLYLVEEKYLDYLSKDELHSVMFDVHERLNKAFHALLKDKKTFLMIFSLLKNLMNDGDPVASKVLKEEILKKVKEGTPEMLYHLLEERYFKFLSSDKLSFLDFDDKEELIKSFRTFLQKDFFISQIEEKEGITITLSDLLRIKFLRFMFLKEVGDPDAVRIFNEEIGKRITSGNGQALDYVVGGGFLNYLSNEEVHLLMFDENEELNEIFRTFMAYKGGSMLVWDAQFPKRQGLNQTYSLLKRLIKGGDIYARRVFKEEISKRIKEGESSMFLLLIRGNFFEFLSKEELHFLVFDEENELNNLFRSFLDDEGDESKFLLEITMFLLMRLTDLGDTLGKSIFEEEMKKLFTSGHYNKVGHLLHGSWIWPEPGQKKETFLIPYLDHLDSELELELLEGIRLDLIELGQDHYEQQEWSWGGISHFWRDIFEKFPKFLLDKFDKKKIKEISFIVRSRALNFTSEKIIRNLVQHPHFFENLGKIHYEDYGEHSLDLNSNHHDYSQWYDNINDYLFEFFADIEEDAVDTFDYVKKGVLKSLEKDNPFEMTLIIKMGILTYFSDMELIQLPANLKYTLIRNLFIEEYGYYNEKYLKIFEQEDINFFVEAFFKTFKGISAQTLLDMLEIQCADESLLYRKLKLKQISDLFTDPNSTLPQNIVEILSSKKFNHKLLIEFLTFCFKSGDNILIKNLFASLLDDGLKKQILDNLRHFSQEPSYRKESKTLISELVSSLEL